LGEHDNVPLIHLIEEDAPVGSPDADGLGALFRVVALQPVPDLLVTRAVGLLAVQFRVVVPMAMIPCVRKACSTRGHSSADSNALDRSSDDRVSSLSRAEVTGIANSWRCPSISATTRTRALLPGIRQGLDVIDHRA